MCRAIKVTQASALLAALSFVFVGTAQAQMEPGTDCWETQVGSSKAVGPFPPGFFGDVLGIPSDAMPQLIVPIESAPLPPSTCTCDPDLKAWVNEHVNPGEPGDIHKVDQNNADYDTCVERPNQANFGGGVGVPESIPIEIIELSLQSSAPIQITYGGGDLTSCDLFITLDGAQGLGSLELTPITVGPDPTGTMLLQGLPMNLRIVYICSGPGAAAASQVQTGLITNYAGTTGFFGLITSVPALGGWGRGLVALVLTFAVARRLRPQRVL